MRFRLWQADTYAVSSRFAACCRYGFINDYAWLAGLSTITGAAGADSLTGGADTFVFAATAANNGDDTITDFTVGAGNDVLDVSAFITISDVTALADDAEQVLAAGTDDDVFVVDFDGAIGALDFGGGDFGDLFGAGKAFLTDDPAAAISNVIVVQGTDETQVYYLNDAGGAVIQAGDVTQVATLDNVVNTDTFVAANFT